MRLAWASIRVLGEQRVGLHVAAPEADGGAVREDQFLPLRLDEPVVPRRFLVEVAEVDEAGGGIEGVAEPGAGVRRAIALVEGPDPLRPLGQSEGQRELTLARRDAPREEQATDHPLVPPLEVDVRKVGFGGDPEHLTRQDLPLPALLVQQDRRLAFSPQHHVLVGGAELQAAADGIGRGLGHVEAVGRHHLVGTDRPVQRAAEMQGLGRHRPVSRFAAWLDVDPGPLPVGPPEQGLHPQDRLAVQLQHRHGLAVHRVLQLSKDTGGKHGKQHGQAAHGRLLSRPRRGRLTNVPVR